MVVIGQEAEPAFGPPLHYQGKPDTCHLRDHTLGVKLDLLNSECVQAQGL